LSIISEVWPSEVYNLACQSHVGISFQEPIYSVEVGTVGTIALLQAVMQVHSQDSIKFYQASSSEMFGMSPPPQSERTPFRPRSPYACGKVYSYYQTINYREAYGMFACNGILFNHETNTPETPILIKKNNKIHVITLDELAPKDGSMLNYPDIEVWDNGSWVKITHVSRYQEKKKIRRLLSRSGYIECTLGHKICGLESDKAIDDLNNGELIAPVILPEHYGKDEGRIKEAALAWVAGFFVGDGSLHGFHKRRSDGKLDFFNKNIKYLSLVESFIKVIDEDAMFEYTPYESGYKPGNFNIRMRVTSKIMNSLLEDCYYEKKPKALKRVPMWVFNSSLKTIEIFLEGYCAADGTKALPRSRYKFQYYTTISQVLAAGLKVLCNWTGRNVIYNCEKRENPTKTAYYHRGFIRSQRNEKLDGQRGNSGYNLMKNPLEIRKIWDDTADEFVTITTSSGKFSAGTGLIRIYNSPRRGGNFVTKKIVDGLVRIKRCKQDKLYLGNLDAKRDWGFAGDYVEAMWLMLQQEKPDDYVVATGEMHSVRDFLDVCADILGLDWKKYVEIDKRYIRPAEVDCLCGDASKAKDVLGWTPKTSFNGLVKMMIDEVLASTHD